MAKAVPDPSIQEGAYDVREVHELNFFDLTGAKAKTKGTSNKMFHAELQVAKSGDKAQIYTMYGPTGRVQTREWRNFDNETIAKREYDKLIKSKRAKGYKDIDIAQRAYGSDDAKKITKAVQLKNAEDLQKEAPKSKLDSGQKRLVEIFFGSQQHFVATTLKCPLGQLTNKQIDEGRIRLDNAKLIVNAASSAGKSLSKKDKDQLLELTNEFYGLIPHNLGAGARGQMDHLLLDDLTKIMGKEDDLDTLLDAKAIGALLSSEATLDAKYDTLNADINLVSHDSPLFRWIADYFQQTKVSGHGYGGAKVKNVWSMQRKDREWHYFMHNAERIAKDCGRHNFAEETNKLSNGKSKNWVPSLRPDLTKEEIELFNKANIWLCWHGTRSANLVGITTRGLLVRPSGAVHTGSMYGDGKYYAWQSTKSLNYTDGGYWTGGKAHNDSRFMFLLDVAFGNMHIANGPHFYKGPPGKCHSVYGKAHHSGVYNDEMITYDTTPERTQGRIKYLLEITDR